jgi:hypothetical protein
MDGISSFTISAHVGMVLKLCVPKTLSIGFFSRRRFGDGPVTTCHKKFVAKMESSIKSKPFMETIIPSQGTLKPSVRSSIDETNQK